MFLQLGVYVTHSMSDFLWSDTFLNIEISGVAEKKDIWKARQAIKKITNQGNVFFYDAFGVW